MTTNVDRIAELFHALADPTRIEILDALRGGEQCVCELMTALDVAQSRLSFHLKVLKEAGLIQDRPEGRWMYYRLCTESLDEMKEFVASLKEGKGVRRAGSCC
ncbi:MAG: metalloregulator ArsR/SmtB family transcription factor [Nitrospira sp.]